MDLLADGMAGAMAEGGAVAGLLDDVARGLIDLPALQRFAFAERIRSRTGVYPGIYSGEYHLAQVLNSARVTPAQRKTLTNCWLWVANYSKEPRATAPWSYWALWQYCGDGKCRLPRSAYPIGIANIRKAELNVFRGSRSDLEDFWQRRAWNPSGGAPRRESERTVTAEL